MVVHMSGLVDYCRRNDYFLVNYQIRKVCAQGDPGRVFGTVQDVVQELSQRRIHPSSGVHHLFLKEDKFQSELACFTLANTCLPQFSSVSHWVSVKLYIAGK